jgi:Dolichyl-phosphate-mannose-protein mannosyltransferase
VTRPAAHEAEALPPPRPQALPSASVAQVHIGLHAGSLAAAGALVLATGILCFVAATRFLDTDEGYHALATARILHGELPYRDFFYPQMPLTAYAYAAWGGVVGDTWYSLRTLSALLALGVGLLLYADVRSRHGRSLAALAVLLYGSSSLVLGWFTTIKTYALSTLLLFGAYLLARRASAGAWRWLACGALAGFAVDTRLLYAAALPALGWAAWTTPRRGRSLAFLAAGSIAALLPVLVLLAEAPRRFAFDNLGYHAVRSSSGLVGNPGQKIDTLAGLFGVGTTEGAIGARAFGGQSLMLVLLAVAAAIALRPLNRQRALALAIAVCLGVASLLPTPSYVQYFAAVIPFLVVVGIEFVAHLGELAREARLRRMLGALLGCAVVLYVGLGLADAVRYARVSGSEEARIGFIGRVAQVVDAQTRPGDEVLSTWPGYLFETHARAVPGVGLANFALIATERTSAADAARDGVLRDANVVQLLRDRVPKVVVYKPWEVAPSGLDWPALVLRSGYRLLPSVGSAEIFVRTD